MDRVGPAPGACRGAVPPVGAARSVRVSTRATPRTIAPPREPTNQIRRTHPIAGALPWDGLGRGSPPDLPRLPAAGPSPPGAPALGPPRGADSRDPPPGPDTDPPAPTASAPPA